MEKKREIGKIGNNGEIGKIGEFHVMPKLANSFNTKGQRVKGSKGDK